MAVAPFFSRIMAEYEVSKTAVSLLTSSVALLMALFTLVGGIIAAKIGLKRSISLQPFQSHFEDYLSAVQEAKDKGASTIICAKSLSSLPGRASGSTLLMLNWRKE